MSTVPFSSLYPLIANHCKRVPTPLMDAAIRDALREFCMRSKFLQDTIPVSIVVNTSWYPLTPVSPTEEVIGIHAVQYNGYTYPVPLNPSTPESDSGQWPCARPYRFYFEPPNNLVVQPLPQQPLANGLYVRIIRQPLEIATTFDYTISQQYDRWIAAGAKAFIMATNDSPWADPVKAREWRAMFEEGYALAASNRQSGFRPRNLLTAVPRY